MAFFHFTPLINGVPVVNAEANVNVDKFGRVSSMGSSWTSPSLAQRHAEDAKTSATDALVALATSLGFSVDASAVSEQADGSNTVLNGASFATGLVTAELKYYRTESSVEKVFEVILPTQDHYYNGFVSVSSGKVVSVNV